LALILKGKSIEEIAPFGTGIALWEASVANRLPIVKAFRALVGPMQTPGRA
jgi:hypothetical protein